MFLDTVYTFYPTYTILDVEGLRIIYVLPDNIAILRDEIYDHAFILFGSSAKIVVDWRKIKNECRKNIHAVTVRRPLSYLQGYALMLPSTVKVERDEILIRIDDDHIARLFSYSISGKRFIPHRLKDKTLSYEEEQNSHKLVVGQPLIDISTMSSPTPNHCEQIPLL